MSKNAKQIVLFVLFFSAVLELVTAEQKMSVTVQETQARERPSFIGRILAVLQYGDRLSVVEDQNQWARVVLPRGGEGWVHLSALTKKRIVMKAGAADVEQTASSEEVALAGKGFNEEVEQKYKEENDLDYTWVDKMEEIEYPAEVLLSFLEGGGQ